MRKSILIWLAVNWLMCCCQTLALAETFAGNYSMPLSKFMLKNEAITLRNAADQYDISFPIADRVKPVSAKLKLIVNNSNVLKNNRSQLVIYANDFVVGQIRLDPVKTHSELDLQIEPEFLRPGYNRISFRAAQHYTDSECEDWGAAELWSTIDSVKSSLNVTYQALPVEESLSALPQLINDRLTNYAVTILRAGDEISDQYLQWGALLTQAVKLRLKHVPMTIHEQQAARLGGTAGEQGSSLGFDMSQLSSDAILVGNHQQLDGILTDSIKQRITGPYLGIFRQPQQPSQFLLVVSGLDDAQVSTAVQALASLSMPLPDQQSVIIDQVNLPVLNALSGQQLLPDTAYRFADLGFASVPLTAHNRQANMRLQMPADLYSTEDRMVTLNLNLAYGAALRGDSVINVMLNDTFVHAIRLKESEGAHYWNYRLQVPLRSFLPGNNEFSFQAVLVMSESGYCTLNQTDNLIAQIYADSSISIPAAGHTAVLPNLAMTQRTGFPFVDRYSARDTAVTLVDDSSDSIAATWLLMSHMAVIANTPLFDLHISQAPVPDKKNHILLGHALSERLPVDWLEDAPVKPGKQGWFPYSNQAKQIEAEGSVLAGIERKLFDAELRPATQGLQPDNTHIQQTAGLGGQYLLMAYPNVSQDGLRLVLLSDPEQSLFKGVDTLLSAGLWGQMQGNVFVWDQTGHFKWLQEGKTIIVGEEAHLNLIGHFSRYPWQWLILVVSLLLLFAWVIHKLLNHYQKSQP